MAEYKSANVTKYDAGGSGDNYIADGYIKSVEKVWIDSINNTVALDSDDTIAIGRVPKNKKITDVTVYLPVMGGAANSLATVFLGTGTAMLMTAGSCYLGNMINMRALEGIVTINIGTAQTITLTPDKRHTVTNKDVVLYLRLLQANSLPFVLTAGTIRSIIKYT